LLKDILANEMVVKILFALW